MPPELTELPLRCPVAGLVSKGTVIVCGECRRPIPRTERLAGCVSCESPSCGTDRLVAWSWVETEEMEEDSESAPLN